MKGKYFSPEKNKIYQEYRLAQMDMADALAKGDIATAKKLAEHARTLDTQLNSGGRGNSVKLTQSPEEVLGAECTDGEIYIILKSGKGTACFKQTPGAERKRKYVYINAEEVWPH